jgi:hypothetical protein
VWPLLQRPEIKSSFDARQSPPITELIGLLSEGIC